MIAKRLGTALFLVTTLFFTLACGGMMTGFSGPPIGEVEAEAGAPFELEVQSTGRASRVWIVYAFHYEDAEPELRVQLTASAPGIEPVRTREVLPGNGATRGTGTFYKSKTLIELPSVDKGETIRIRGTIRPGPGNHLDSARITVTES